MVTTTAETIDARDRRPALRAGRGAFNENAASALLQTGVDHLARGDAQAALRAVSEACHADPTRAEAHYVYGQVWTALGKPTRAEQAFAAAIQLRPDWADAWVNYGLARYQQGVIGDAKIAMARALAASPHHPAATANLGAFLRITGEHERAEPLLREALRLDPDHAGARLNLVADLMQEERAADALALLDEAAPPQDPHSARHWHLQRALALVVTGRPQEARAALGEFDELGPTPQELRPLRLWRRVLIARAEGRLSDAQAEAGAMAAALDDMGPNAVPEHRIMGHYDLAKFWSEQSEPSAAFAHWTAGHKLLSVSQPFSRDAEKAFADATIATFTEARFTAGPVARNDDPAPVFIVGMPRSGTTLCEQIIASHAQAHGAGERSALGRLFYQLGGDETPEGVARIAGLPQETLDAAAATYLAELHALAPDKARIVDKMPGNYRYAWLIALLFPKARIIHCMRDPRDIGLSIFTFRFYGHHGYAHDLADLGWMIGEQDRLMTHWKAALPNPILTVHLADWVRDFDGTLARVLSHLDLPFDSACARFHEAGSSVRTVSRAQVRQPVNARGLGRWKAYAAELAPLIAELDRAEQQRPASQSQFLPHRIA
jgi:Tfp pilus assembly protein PilF